MKLYGAVLSPYVARVVLQIRRKGLDIPVLPVPDGDLKSATYLSLNPYGKMPTLDADGTPVIESEVICEFLEDRFPEPPLLPPDPAGRARSRTVDRAVDLYVLPPLQGLVGQMNPATRDRAVADQKMAELRRGLDGLERLVTGPWAVGEQMTLADCALIPTCFYLERFLPAFGRVRPFAETPRLASVWATARKDALVATVLAEMARALDEFLRVRAANA